MKIVIFFLLFFSPVVVFAESMADRIKKSSVKKTEPQNQSLKSVSVFNPTNDPDIAIILERLNSMRTKKPLTVLPPVKSPKVNP